MLNALMRADEKGIKQIAFPPMGAGFYAIPLTVCASVMIQALKEYLSGPTGIEEVIICPLDRREYIPFEAALASLGN